MMGRSPLLLIGTVALAAFNVAYANVMPDILAEHVPTHPWGFSGTPSPRTGADVAFVDVAAAAGIDARRPAWGSAPTYPEIITGGVAAADVDGNGWADLYFPPGGPRHPGKLYLNQGGWVFQEAGTEYGLAGFGVGAGAGFADMDNDGDPDLAVAVEAGLRIHRNDGGRFTDVTAASGATLAGVCRNGCLPSSLLWTDADADGRLDLFVVNNLDWRDPDLHSSGNDYTSLVTFGRPQRTVLLRGAGDGTFVDATLELDLWGVAKGLGVTASDLDGDGAAEILTANDVTPNAVFRRAPAAASYRDVGAVLGADEVKSSMGIQAADLTGDGRPDILVSNLRGHFLSLLVQREDGTFRHETHGRGLQGTGNATGWGVAAFDADLDGWLDIAHAAGRPAPLGPHEDDVGNLAAPRLKQDSGDQLFRNLGGTFGDATRATAFDDGGGITRAILAVDLDNDGDEDVVRVQLDGRPAQVLRNDGDHGASLVLDFEGTRSNRDGFGARVEVRLPDGRLLVRELVSGAGYQTGLDGRLVVGIGEAAQAQVTVRWPAGTVQDLGELAPGPHRVREPA